MSALSAGQGVTQVMHRCEWAKESKCLDLSNCNMMYVADAIYMVLKGYQVFKVSLASNKLKKFPIKMVGKFPNIVSFNIAGNAVTEVPEEILRWTQLRVLNMAENGLEQIPEVIFRLPNLKQLDLSKNKLQQIDTERLSSGLPHLTTLDLSCNPLPQDMLRQIQAWGQTKGIEIKYRPPSPEAPTTAEE